MRFLIIIFFLSMLVSCRQPEYLQNDLNRRRASVSYLHDKEINNSPKTDTVIVKLNKGLLDSITRVSKLNRLVIPLIIFNYSEINMIAKLGEQSLQERYANFFMTNLIDESERTGCFYISDNTENENYYSLDITIDTCKTSSVYRHNYTFLYLGIAYMSFSKELAFEARTNIKATFKLKKKGVLIAEKHYDINKHQPFLYNFQRNNLDQFRDHFLANMCESLSLCSKECIETMIKDVNTIMRSK